MAEEEQLGREMLAYTEGEGESWWSGFQPRHLKLHLIKAMLNYTAPRLRELSPDREPTLAVSQLVDRACVRLLKVLDAEEKGPLGDRNLRNLVEAGRRALIYVAEEDCYYQDWLALAVMALYTEVQAEMAGWSPEDDPRLRELSNADEIMAKPGGRELLFYWSLRHRLPIEKKEG